VGPSYQVGLGIISKPYGNPINEVGRIIPPSRWKKKKQGPPRESNVLRVTQPGNHNLRIQTRRHVTAKPRPGLPHGGDILNRITLPHLISFNPLIEGIIQPPQTSIPPKHQEGALHVGPARLPGEKRGHPDSPRLAGQEP